MNQNTIFLRIPLNKLYFIDDIENFSGLSDDDLLSLKKEYDDQEIERIVASIVWATQNPNYDFSSLLPNLRHNNTEIYKYLCKLKHSFK